MYILGE